MTSPVPKSPGQTDKTKRYDRQLRLWGDHGQVALESAHVCLINATATGTEVLKSLVLPGIGAFTIVDGSRVTGEDVGNNFFLDQESIGKSRAQVATQLLLELNSEVRGDYVDEPVEQLLANNANFFSNFSVVIATALSERHLSLLSSRLWELNVPLVVCKSYGFLGYIRLQIGEHCVIETHPDNTLDDLRLDRPFPGLRAYMDKINLAEMDRKTLCHTPYLVLLYKALEKWRENGNDWPKTYKQKESLRDIIRNDLKSSKTEEDDNTQVEDENVTEALKAVNTALGRTNIPANVAQIFEDENCHQPPKQSFWILAKALKEFVNHEGGGALPLRGTLPDMTSDSERYIALQNVYREQANKDADAVLRRAQAIVSERGWSKDLVTEQEARIFCKNAYSLRVIKGRSIAAEYDSKQAFVQDIGQHLEDPDSLIVQYVLLRGVDRFQTEYGTYPGLYDDTVEPDIGRLKGCISRLLSEWGLGSLGKDDHVHEICRYGASELHSVAAFIGGSAAHEVIKLVTNQYVPIDNTFIFSAVTCTSATFKF